MDEEEEDDDDDDADGEGVNDGVAAVASDDVGVWGEESDDETADEMVDPEAACIDDCAVDDARVDRLFCPFTICSSSHSSSCVEY